MFKGEVLFGLRYPRVARAIYAAKRWWAPYGPHTHAERIEATANACEWFCEAHKTAIEERDEAARQRDDYRRVIRAALDRMETQTDMELGPGGGARIAYAALWHAYYAIPAGIASPPSTPPSGEEPA